MANYIFIDANNKITNIIDWDGVADYPLPSIPIQFSGASGIGWHWDGTSAVDPNAPVLSGPVVPQSVSPRQARLALVQVGLYPQVQQAIAAADQATQVWWEFASTIDRQNPLLLTMATQLGLDAARLDGLFTLASQL
jgi:hypothetical protein